jgi:hypothetical protein
MSVPVPPVRDPRGTRHTMPVVRRAVQLHEAGWTPTEIRRRLEEELGVRPAIGTIRGWVEPGYREFMRRQLSHEAIARVARRFFAVELSSHGVRRWLDRLGAPKNPLKARPPRVTA